MDHPVVLSTLVALLLYYNTLHADFAYDDSRAIKTNPDVLPSTPWTQLLFNDFWGTPLTHSGSHKSYRPLCVLSFRLNYWLHEFQAWGYHLTNVLLHGCATALFTQTAQTLFRGKRFPAWVAGLSFATHPIHTEAVAGVVGRADVGAAIFFLLSFWAYRRYAWYRTCLHHESSSSAFGGKTASGGGGGRSGANRTQPVVPGGAGGLLTIGNKMAARMWIRCLGWFAQDSGTKGTTASLHDTQCAVLWLRKWTYLLVTVVCATCSMLTKEHGVTVLAVCALYDILVHSKVKLRELPFVYFQRKYYGLLEGLLVLTASGGALVATRFHLMGSKPPEFAPADNPAADCAAWLPRLLTFAYLPVFNLGLLLHPATLSFDWSMEAIPLVTQIQDGRNLFSLVFYAVLGYVVVKLGRNSQVRRGALRMTSGHAFWLPCPPVGGSTVPLAAATEGVSQEFSPSNGETEVAGLKNGHAHGQSSSLVTSSSSASSSSNNIGGTGGCWEDSVGGGVEYDSLDLTVIALAMMILPFLPASNLFFYVGFVVAERVLYVPSLGYCLLVAVGAQFLRTKCGPTRRTRWLLYGALAALFLLFATRTVRRNEDWRTEENLYRSGILVNPPKAYGNLANILSSTGRKEEAEWAYKKALSYRSNMADVHYNLGILYQEQKRYEEAITAYKSAINYRPRMAMAHLNLGLVLALLGQKEEAVEVYRRCSQLDGSGLKDPRTHEATKISALFNLGRLYADEGLYQKAVDVYLDAIQRMPLHYQAQSLYNMLGEAYFKMEKYREAEHWYKEALRVKPDHVPAHLTYGKLLSKMNRLVEAEEWFLRALSLAPNDSSVYQHFGQFLSESERHAEAAEQYVKAAHLAPMEYEIIFNAANTLRQAGRHVDAERYYRLAVRLRPNEATSHMNLGAMLHVNGKLLEAEQSYLEALRFKPDDHITRTNLQKLRHLLTKKGLASSERRR